MKVIFLEDVTNVARTGEVKEVADGYFRNYLLPKKLAATASPAAMKSLETDLKLRARRRAQTEAEFAALAQQLEGKEVVLKATAGSKARLYGSITSADIAAGLEKSGIILDKRRIDLDKPIRQLGAYEVVVKLSKDLAPKLRVIVEEEAPEKEAEPGGESPPAAE